MGEGLRPVELDWVRVVNQEACLSVRVFSSNFEFGSLRGFSLFARIRNGFRGSEQQVQHEGLFRI
jgi:hypothetical protein